MGVAWHAVEPSVAAPAAPPQQQIHQALAASAEAAELLAETAGGDLLILVNDSHRATQTAPVLAALGAIGSASGWTGGVTVLVATGTHRFPAEERADFEQRLRGATELPIAEVAWHDASGRLTAFAGAGWNPRVASATHILAIGSVEPHYFAGLTGAHKTCTIGVLGRGDIESNHAGALDLRSEPFALHGNPVFDGIARLLAGLQGSRRIVAVNQVVASGNLLAVAVGEPLATLRQLSPVARDSFARVVEDVADVLHLRVPPPLGRTLYQADKALKNNHRAVRDGGVVVLDAGCEDGVGPAAFLELLRSGPTAAAAEAQVVTRGYRLGDHKAVKLRQLTDPAGRGVRVIVASPGVSAAEAALCGCGYATCVTSALADAERLVGGGGRGVRIEDAGHVVVMPR